jgi:quinolinate synthase
MLIPLITDYEKAHITERQSLPERYLGLSDEEMDRRIAEAKATLGRRLVILGHHYQRDEVMKFADFTGDSFKLARHVSERPDAEFVVFCGVHFMAESADVLTTDEQQVILPDLAAGCSMADMADAEQLEQCWSDLHEMIGEAGPANAGHYRFDGRVGGSGVGRSVASGSSRTGIVPITYINSSAAIKSFCGEHDGVVCTSSNAAGTLRWAWARPSTMLGAGPSTSLGAGGNKILFLPDQHLGRNTAYALGVPLDEMVVWDPNEIWGGLEPEDVRRARIILWKGHCSVHTRFTTRQIDQVRALHPGVKVIVHPEVPWDVVQAADDCGSTEYIIKTISESPTGSTWAVGTELHLVNRLARQLDPERTVLSLEPFGCLCSTMFRVSPNHLLWVLEGLVAGEVHNRIVVPDHQKHWTRVALDRMLSIH